MAIIRDTAVTIYAAATTSNMVCDMPVHEVGDLLIAFVGKDGASGFTTPTTGVGTPVSSSNWTLIRSSTSTGAGGGIYALRATSSSENVTFPLTLDTCVAVIVCVKDVYGSTVADAIPTSVAYAAEDSTLPFGGVAITTAHSNSLLFQHRFSDTTIGTAYLPPWVNVWTGDAGNGGSTVAYSFEPTASTVVSAPNMWSGGLDDGKASAIEVRDGSSGVSIPPYIPLDVVPSVLISPLVGTTGVIDKGTYTAVSANTITTVAGKTVAGIALATTSDSGYNPFRGSARNAGASSTTNLNAIELNLTSTQDVTTGDLIFGTYLHLAPRDYLDSGSVARGGKYFLAGSTSANWRAWVVGGQFSKTDNSNARVNWLVQPSRSTNEYDSAGTPNFASLDIMQFGSSGYYGAPSILWNELWELRTAVVAGGSPTSPFNFDGLVNCVNRGCGDIPVLLQAGSAAQVWIPLQIGGTDPIGIGINLRTFQWPRQADPSAGYVDFHVDNDKLGIEFYGLGSGDYIHFTNCVFTSDSSYYWRFNTSHSASTDTDFSGTTIVGANVTLRSTVTLDAVSFVNTSAFALNSAAITNSTFNNSKISTGVIAELADVQNCEFISSGTGHGIEIIGTAGDVTLTGLTFTDYAGSNGSTGNEAIYVNIATGTCIITITGGNTPSIRTAGATVVVVTDPVTTLITVKDIITGSVIENARVQLTVTSGANFPFEDSVTITSSGTVATVSHTNHGLVTGDWVKIEGAVNSEQYNGSKQITNTGTNSYTYAILTGQPSPATGTITSTMMFFNGLTNASGQVSDTRTLSAAQPVTGWVRRGSTPPFYKEQPISETISNTNGLTLNVSLIPD